MATLWGWAASAVSRVTSGLPTRWWGNSGRGARTPHMAFDAGYLPGSSINFEAEAGPLELNSAVAACLGWMTDEWAKADFQVERTRRDGTVEPAYGHDLAARIDEPNRFDSGQDLWAATLKDYIVDGNAYWLLVRDALGEVAEIWHVPAWRCEPAWSIQGDEWIGGYLVDVDGTPHAVAPSAIVHFKDGKDLYNERKGCSRLKAGLRSICGLNQAETITYLLTHSPIPGMIVSKQVRAGGGDAEDMPDIGQANAVRLKAMAEAKTSNDNRYKVAVIETGIKVDLAGWSPEQLALDRLPIIPESTVCALIGIAPQVTGLRSAAEHAAYATADVAVRRSWSRLQAIQGRFAATITRQLLRTDYEPSPKFRCGWDYSRVDALSEQAESKAKRAVDLFRERVVTRNEAREIIGLDALDGPEHGDVFADNTGPGAIEMEPEADPAIEDTLPGDETADEQDDNVPEPVKARMNGHINGKALA